MENRLQQLEQDRDRLTNKGYMMLLEQIPILAVPAVAAVTLGRYLTDTHGLPKYTLAILLVIALWASWKFILYRLNKFQSRLRVITDEIKQIKSEQVSSNSNQ